MNPRNGLYIIVPLESGGYYTMPLKNWPPEKFRRLVNGKGILDVVIVRYKNYEIVETIS